MQTSDYELLDSGDQKKLERFGSVIVVRPSAQAVWDRRLAGEWDGASATFTRQSSGEGTWSGSLPDSWTITHAGITWGLRPNSFGHLGIFPEQEPGWRWIDDKVGALRAASEEIHVLNLFGYTGGSSLAAARAGAHVCHVDASKTSVRLARENAALSGLDDRPVRWITEDAVRFVDREIRRERRYRGVILDPPTYGRGTRGETWKIDDGIRPLLEKCRPLLLGDGAFVLLSSHSPGYTPLVLENLLRGIGTGSITSGEMTIGDRSGRPLPSGTWARWEATP